MRARPTRHHGHQYKLNPDASRRDALNQFYDVDPMTISFNYTKWINFSYQKYVENDWNID